MQLRRFTIFPFHIFLIPLFFVWHIINEYFGLIPFKYSGTILMYYFGLSVVLFLIGKLLLKDTVKAGCLASIGLMIFFFWGVVHDFLKSLHLPAFFVSYKFLFAIVLILVTIFIISLRKRKDPPFRLSRFFTLLFGLFVLAEAIISIYKKIDDRDKKNALNYYNIPLLQRTELNNLHTPDIFLIIFDEYASSASLRQYEGYDNSLLDSILIRNNFFVVKDSKSNYNFTPLSISSILDGQYFNKPLEGRLSDPLLSLEGQYTIKHSYIPQLFSQQGYEIINLGMCDLKDAPAPVESLFNSNCTGLLYKETLWGRMENEIWWHIRNNTGMNWTLMQSDKEINFPATNRANYQHTLDELNTQSNKPKLVITHLMMPHAPFYYDRTGAVRPDPYFGNLTFPDSLYIDQLIYTNTWIDSIAQAANHKNNRPRVVIIAGDHGYRDKKNDPATRNKQFMNLNAWYFSDGDYSQLYDSISSVNSFRVILNKYFQANLPLLKDSTIRIIE